MKIDTGDSHSKQALTISANPQQTLANLVKIDPTSLDALDSNTNDSATQEIAAKKLNVVAPVLAPPTPKQGPITRLPVELGGKI